MKKTAIIITLTTLVAVGIAAAFSVKCSFCNGTRQAIMACRKGGTVSLPGVYIGLLDKIPLGAAHGKGLTFKMGQTHMQRYMQPLLDKIEGGEIDPSFIISHRIAIEDAPDAYEKFRTKTDSCTKVVIKPGMASDRDLFAEKAAEPEGGLVAAVGA